jgi:hypothetical protein
MGNSEYDTQLMINMSATFASEERYLLQPTKTVALHIRPSKGKKCETQKSTFNLGPVPLNNVETAPHLGITRASTVEENMEVNVNKNIGKARRALYSLLGAGLHGVNGLDPVTSINIYKVYILPILLYGLEITLPSQKYVTMLEKFQKDTIKNILSLPNSVADPSVYILTGLLPVQAILDLKVLRFFNNLVNQADDSLEKQLLIRQLTVKGGKSRAWAKQVQPLLAKYELGSVFTYLDYPLTKDCWKRNVHVVIEENWRKAIESQANLYSSLKYMNCVYTPGKSHPILRVPCSSSREAKRLPPRLRVLTGTFILQVNRARFNQNQIDTLCPLCREEDETLQHFILRCRTLQPARESALDEICVILQRNGIAVSETSPCDLVNLIVDWSNVFPTFIREDDFTHQLEFQTRRLLFNLHTLRNTLYRNSLLGDQP